MSVFKRTIPGKNPTRTHSLEMLAVMLQDSTEQKLKKQRTMKELLEFYYKGFAEKANWESVIADGLPSTTMPKNLRICSRPSWREIDTLHPNK